MTNRVSDPSSPDFPVFRSLIWFFLIAMIVHTSIETDLV
jgi:hypothetical protein